MPPHGHRPPWRWEERAHPASGSITPAHPSMSPEPPPRAIDRPERTGHGRARPGIHRRLHPAFPCWASNLIDAPRNVPASARRAGNDAAQPIQETAVRLATLVGRHGKSNRKNDRSGAHHQCHLQSIERIARHFEQRLATVDGSDACSDFSSDPRAGTIAIRPGAHTAASQCRTQNEPAWRLSADTRPVRC